MSMYMCWCLSDSKRQKVLDWCSMPVELYESLAIVHKMAVVEEWLNDTEWNPKEDEK